MIVLPLWTAVWRPVWSVEPPSTEWSPAEWFALGEQGAYLRTQPVVSGQQALYQDEAGTLAVSSIDEPIAHIADLSGNTHSATNPISSQRMIYRGSNRVERDGVDDYLIMPDLPWGPLTMMADATSAWTFVWAGTVTSGTLGFAIEEDNANRIIRFGDLMGQVTIYLRGTLTQTGLLWADATRPVVVTVTWNGTAATMVVRFNGVDHTFTPDVGTHPALGGDNPTIGARGAAGGSLHSAGDFLGLVLRNGAQSGDETLKARDFFDGLTPS